MFRLVTGQEATNEDRQLRACTEQGGSDPSSLARVVPWVQNLLGWLFWCSKRSWHGQGCPLPSALPARAEGRAELQPALETWLHHYPCLVSRRRICILQEVLETACDVGDTHVDEDVTAPSDGCAQVLVGGSENIAQS